MFLGHTDEIYRYLRSMEEETKRRPLANFMEKVQTDITPTGRSILVDWIVDVVDSYKLSSETLYLAVSYIDRFLSSISVSKKNFQLLGVCSLLIASKYEEIEPRTRSVKDFCAVADNSFTKEELVKMELDMLKVLNFEIGSPTIKNFLSIFVRVGKVSYKYPDPRLENLSNFFAELSLVDDSCVRFLPSAIAASAVFLARFTLNPKEHPWSSTLQHQTGYKLPELKDCIHALHDLQFNRKMLRSSAIREKYSQDRLQRVSTLHTPLIIPMSYFQGF